jgi:hypothetical protein
VLKRDPERGYVWHRRRLSHVAMVHASQQRLIVRVKCGATSTGSTGIVGLEPKLTELYILGRAEYVCSVPITDSAAAAPVVEKPIAVSDFDAMLKEGLKRKGQLFLPAADGADAAAAPAAGAAPAPADAAAGGVDADDSGPTSEEEKARIKAEYEKLAQEGKLDFSDENAQGGVDDVEVRVDSPVPAAAAAAPPADEDEDAVLA